MATTPGPVARAPANMATNPKAVAATPAPKFSMSDIAKALGFGGEPAADKNENPVTIPLTPEEEARIKKGGRRRHRSRRHRKTKATRRRQRK